MPDSQFPSEEAVEAAARELWGEDEDFTTPWAAAGQPAKDAHRKMARRMLAAAAPFLSPERSGGGIVETTAGEVRVGDEVWTRREPWSTYEWCVVKSAGLDNAEVCRFRFTGYWTERLYKATDPILVRRGEHS